MDAQSTIPIDKLVDALNEGIIRAIQTSGKVLPSSSISALNSSPVQCEWIEFATELCCPVVEDLRQIFVTLPLEGSEVGSDGRPLLYAACLGLLLSQRDREDGDSSEKKSTPLSTFLSIASFLLDDLEVDPNQPTLTPGACLRPPLHLIARSCRPSAARALLCRGADANLPDEEGWTPLMACCLPGQGQGGATTEERVETIKALLRGDDKNDATIDVDARNYCGYTALHYACEGLISSLVCCLLKDGGADATLRTVWGQSCIGIIKTQSTINMEEAEKCEALIRSHLEMTGQIETVRSFLGEELKAIELMVLLEDVLLPASRRAESDNGSRSLAAQDQRIISALMKYRLNLDPEALFQKNAFARFPHEDGNLYEIIHHRIMEIMPFSYRQVYKISPTNEEREIISCTNFDMRETAEISVDGVRHIDASLLMGKSFRLHRERGHVAQQLDLLTDLIVGPLQRTLAFGIPSNAVLKGIATCAPRIVEMGAGTGYWSLMLSKMGADVVAYDASPLGELDPKNLGSENSNLYFGSQSYFPVREGVASTVFGGSNPEMVDRALLMVWPNNPDAEDNKHVAVEGSILPQIWDLECLQRYHKMGGGTVIFVGERQEKIDLMPDAADVDCGFCASRKFQIFLRDNYDLHAELSNPRWWMKEDDVTIWKRK
ncbi:hypothetical protein ACHAXR_005548 [Thalassiosira sp. AJA248-18]